MFNILNNSDNGSRKLSRSVKYTDVQPGLNTGRITAAKKLVHGSPDEKVDFEGSP